MPALKILKICGSRSWGGLEKFFIDTSEKLHNKGHYVKIACPSDSKIQINANQKKIDAAAFSFNNKISAIFSLNSILKSGNFDIIHSHLSSDLWSVVPAMKLSGSKAKLVLTKAMESGVSKKDFFHRQLYKHVDAVIAISKYIETNIKSTLPVPDSKITVINDAVNTNIFNPILFDCKKTKAQFGIEDEIVISLIGRITWGKGHEDLINAVEIIKAQIPKQKLKVLIAGSAEADEAKYKNKIKNLVKQKNLTDVITFLGYCTNVAEILSATDILVFPSHTESFGIAVLEAMAMGIPVIASNYGGVLDSVEHEKTGVLFERKNPAALAEAMMRLAKDSDLRKKLGQEGQLRVEQNFNLDLHIKKTEMLYEKLLS